MSTAKENINEILARLPDDASYEDILYEIYVKLNIKKGREQIKNGDFLTEEEVFKRYEKWLK